MTPAGASPKVAYVLPAVNPEFILREMLEMGRRGVDLYVFALKARAPDLERRFPSVRELPRPVFYSPYLLSWRLWRAHARFLLRAPGRYLRALGRLLTLGGEPGAVLRALAVFPKAVHFAAIMEREGVTRVHAHWAHFPAAAAMVMADLLGRDFGFTGHAWDIFADPRGLRAKMRRARYVVTCTQYNREHLAALGGPAVDPAKLRVVYHGLEVDRYVPLPGRANPALRILAVGRMVEKKGLRYLVEALHRLRQAGLDFSAEIIGEDGPERAPLLALRERYGLGDVLTVRGYVPHPELIGRMREADLFVLPCVVHEDATRRQDGLPNVFIESLALEVPVVSTPISGIPELVVHGETGILVPPRDVEALVRAIQLLHGDPELRRRLGRNGRARVLRDFDIRRNLDRLKTIILSER